MSWSKRFDEPIVLEDGTTLRTLRDAKAVLLGVDGISDFDGLYARRADDEVQLYAFDMMVDDGNDIRHLPLHMRKLNLDRLLRRRIVGIHAAPFEQGEIGPDLFRAACAMRLEGIVSKRRESRYRPGPSGDWIKVKNPSSPAMTRAKHMF